MLSEHRYELPQISIGPATNTTQNFVIWNQAVNQCGPSYEVPIFLNYNGRASYSTLSVYPNPAKEEVTLSFDSEDRRKEDASSFQSYDIRVYDRMEKLIYEEKDVMHPEKIIKTNEWREGIYYFHIRRGNGYSIEKVVVSHQ